MYCGDPVVAFTATNVPGRLSDAAILMSTWIAYTTMCAGLSVRSAVDSSGTSPQCDATWRRCIMANAALQTCSITAVLAEIPEALLEAEAAAAARQPVIGLVALLIVEEANETQAPLLVAPAHQTAVPVQARQLAKLAAPAAHRLWSRLIVPSRVIQAPQPEVGSTRDGGHLLRSVNRIYPTTPLHHLLVVRGPVVLPRSERRRQFQSRPRRTHFTVVSVSKDSQTRHLWRNVLQSSICRLCAHRQRSAMSIDPPPSLRKACETRWSRLFCPASVAECLYCLEL